MAKSDIHRARPTNGNAASVNSLVGFVMLPTSSSRNPSREPIHVISSEAGLYCSRIAPHPYATVASAPLAIGGAALGLFRSQPLTLFSVLTSTRLPHAGTVPRDRT